ncbi:calcitonin gene-related peptide type 1 receptor-like isoform X1 [Pomacea canaliculata]|uniref:calcitonin gene-related peptide type 1 receptor-like isoform X1 n=1 Tax=Pomacea canaliculata TaxID=400727 RepID=UPI000D728E9E|nr:calcitonin gene-related peptide type 1 receptor-like isoform X1 [Pomacea canaliculata]
MSSRSTGARMDDNGTSAKKQQSILDSAHEDMRQLTAMLHMECSETVLSLARPSDGEVYCNATFDGWGCWNYTIAGGIAVIPCPVFFNNGHDVAVKECELNGTWRRSPVTGAPYANYSSCSRNMAQISAIHHFMPLYLFIAGFSLSIVMLLISLGIFFAFRQLRCERITVHKNLFVSYILTGVVWILYFVLAALDGDVLLANPLWCRMLHVLTQYCTASNFAWMFCEGLYLHVIMTQTFRTGKTLIRVLLFVGWGNPLILAIVYACVRGLYSANTTSCWVNIDSLQWIVFGPVIASIVVNVLILINLVRLLVTKLRMVPDAPQSRKAVRATLILVPLFGMQYLIFPIKPAEDHPLHGPYHYLVACFISLQGALVSIMYCFCNGEVTSLLRRKWHQHRLMSGQVRKNTALTSSTYTEGYSVVNTSMRDLSGQRQKVASDHNKTLARKLHSLESFVLAGRRRNEAAQTGGRGGHVTR